MARQMNDRFDDQRANVSWEAEETQQSLPLLDYLQLLWFRRKLIIAITVFVTVVGYTQINEIKNVYYASATMVVGIPEHPVVDIESVVRRDSSWQAAYSEMEVRRSRGLAAKVIERLNLGNHPEVNPSLREPEESLFDLLQYLDPRKWVPASWKQ